MSLNTHVILPGSYRHVSGGAEAVGVADPSETINLTIKVRRKAPLPDVQPGKILPMDEIRELYGASDSDLTLVSETLKEFGLKIDSTDAAARSVCVSGPVAAVEKAFGTKLLIFEGKGGGRYRGRTGQVHLPAALDKVVEGVFGLDKRPVVRTRLQRSDAKSVPPPGTLFASQLAEVYDFPEGSGKGITIGILEFGGGYFPSDMKMFAADSKIPPPTVKPISVGGASTSTKDGQEDEVMLDVEVVAAVCPEATINVYFAGQAEQDWIDSLDRAMQDSPAVLSISWGLSEDSPDWTPNGRQSIDSALQQAALAGITVCIASGDDGSYDQEPDGRAHVNFPASSPHALAVGGTQFQLINGQRQNEAVWFDGDGKRADKGGASGGGVSVEFDRPAWQTVQVASVNPNPIDGRVLPDIAALAGSPYYAVAVDGKWGGVAGTSAATPLVAALIALMIENLGDKKLPFLAPILYQASGQSTIGATGCTDITVGKNNTAQVGGYAAGPGFDACTGWGVPSGKALLAAIATYLADLP